MKIKAQAHIYFHLSILNYKMLYTCMYIQQKYYTNNPLLVYPLV